MNSLVVLLVIIHEQNTDIVGVVVEVSRDKSWRVRWSLAHRLHDVFAALALAPQRGSGAAAVEGGAAGWSEAAQGALTNLFNNLLNDAEAEVHLVYQSANLSD